MAKDVKCLFAVFFMNNAHSCGNMLSGGRKGPYDHSFYSFIRRIFWKARKKTHKSQLSKHFRIKWPIKNSALEVNLTSH